MGPCCQPVRCTARQPAALVRSVGEEAWRARCLRDSPRVGRSARTSEPRPAGSTGRPRRRRGPISRRIAPDRGLLDREMNRGQLLRCAVIVGVRARVSRRLVDSGSCPDGRRRRRSGSLPLATSVSGLPPGPVLEGGADRERTRQAVRLLVRRSTRCRQRFGVAAVTMIGTRRTRFPIVLERDKRTGRSAVHAGEPSLGHRSDDTRRGTRSALNRDPPGPDEDPGRSGGGTTSGRPLRP